MSEHIAITVRAAGMEIELTTAEARAVYEQLRELFGASTQVQYVRPIIAREELPVDGPPTYAPPPAWPSHPHPTTKPPEVWCGDVEPPPLSRNLQKFFDLMPWEHCDGRPGDRE